MRFKNLLLIVLIAVLFTNWNLNAAAGVTNNGTRASTPPSKAGDNNVAQNRSRLRCWQKGTLLFDELDLNSFSLENKPNVISFSLTKSEKQSLHLVNMGETICLFRSSNR